MDCGKFHMTCDVMLLLSIGTIEYQQYTIARYIQVIFKGDLFLNFLKSITPLKIKLFESKPWIDKLFCPHGTSQMHQSSSQLVYCQIFSKWLKGHDSLLQTIESKLPLHTRWADSLIRVELVHKTQVTSISLKLAEIRDQQSYLRFPGSYIKQLLRLAQVASTLSTQRCDK